MMKVSKRELPSYQLALRVIKTLRPNFQVRGNQEFNLTRKVAREIRAYRAEERRVN